MSQVESTVTLYRPVGQKELDLIRETGWRNFPPRLSWQPIFYPVVTENYAIQIARDWNTKDPESGHVGYVLRFQVRQDYLSRFEPHGVGGQGHVEYWIPAEELVEFNGNIVGQIEILREFRPERPSNKSQ